ncbi:DNA mismatch repair protein Mlh3 isoform X2 [Ambystoma mexicanum]|uniref:DNA mismatch repair protein Mlh3 isoform X2 n=1 Tax=Ambystoma mexicanum TaxID=8296 RepID=UPI0037E8ED97
MIQSLPADVRARLRSGMTICSFGQCMEELLLNSTDAKATCVAIRVDLETFRIQVVDNGTGMGQDDVELAGKRYFTSKCHSVEDLENLKSSGFRGEALASIANMASLVEIMSKSNKSSKTFTKLFQNGKALEVCETEVGRPSIGTTVTVCNLFYNLPVRRQCLDNVLELERVRQKVEAVSFMHPPISFSLRNDSAGSMLLQLPKTKDVSSRFCQIYGLSKTQKLRAVNFEHGGFRMCGYISCEGHYNKNMQFLYVNKRLVLKTRLHKLINFLLRKESVICKSKAATPGRPSSPSRHRTGPELHGIYVIDVTCSYCEYDVCLEPAKTLIEFRDWTGVLRCIEEGIKTFLNQEHLFMVPSSEDIKEFNESNNFILSSTDVQPVISCGKTAQEPFQERYGIILDSFELANLKSKDVLRKASSSTKLLASTPADLIAGVTQPPATNKHDEEISGEAGQSTPAEPLCRTGESTISGSLNEFILETKEAGLVAGKGHQEPKHFPLLKNCPIEVDMCTDGMPSVSVLAKSSAEETEVLHRDTVVDSSPLCTSVSDDDKAVGKCAGAISQSDSETGVQSDFSFKSTTMHFCNAFEKIPHLERRSELEAPGDDSVRLGLCSTGFITHPAAKMIKERTQTYSSLQLFATPGPVCAQDVFGVNMSISKPGENVANPLFGLAKEPSSFQSNRVDNAICTNSKQESSSPSRSSESVVKLPSQKSLLAAATFSSSNRNKAACSIQSSLKKSVFSKPQSCRKLSLFAQLGSLERFRRWCGKVQNPQSIFSSSQDKTNGSQTAAILRSAAQPERTLDHNHNEKSLHTFSTTAPVLPTDPELLVTKPHIATNDKSDWEHLGHPTLALSDYTGSKQPVVADTISLKSLAAKLSKMRGGAKETPALEIHSNVNVECEQLPEANNEGCQMSCLSYTDIGSRQKLEDFPNSYTSQKNSGTYSKATQDPCKYSMFINIVGENKASSCIDLTAGNSMDLSHNEYGVACDQSALLDQHSKAIDPLPDNLVDNINEMDCQRGNTDPKQCCSGWLQRFDVSLGRTIYINKTTGLSSYSAPLEESRATCTKDLTTLAVNVVSKSDVSNPIGEGESLGSLFSEWENPVFARVPQVAVDVSSSEATNLAVKMHNILYPYRFTKEMIHSMKILQQVDNKFIACLINTKTQEEGNPDGNLLVLVDQHAAHERVRLEQLIAESYDSAPEALGRRKLLSSTVCPPLQVEVTEEHKRLLRSCQCTLQDVGLCLSFPEEGASHVLVGKVPLCFVEREANEVRRGRPPVTKAIVEELIREEIEMLQTSGGVRGVLPLTVMKVLASQACHGAIKFNARLSVEECCCLMKSLSGCRLPFQCAHGRPSILPLADVDHLELQKEEMPKPDLKKLKKRFTAWKRFRMEEETALPTTVQETCSEACTQFTNTTQPTTVSKRYICK